MDPVRDGGIQDGRAVDLGQDGATPSLAFVVDGVDGGALEQPFFQPLGIVSDGVGDLFVADYTEYTIRKLVLATGRVVDFAGNYRNQTVLDGVGSAAGLNCPFGLAYDGRDSLFSVETCGHVVRKISLAYDGDGHLYVADELNHLVRKLDVTTGEVTTVVGTPGQSGLALGPLPGVLGWPDGLAFVPPNTLYITDLDQRALLVARFLFALSTTCKRPMGRTPVRTSSGRCRSWRTSKLARLSSARWRSCC
jgi:hypothetical protein